MTAIEPARTPASLMRQPLGWVALGLGSGLLRRAPGTAGSAVAVLLWLAFVQGGQPGLPAQVLLLALAIVVCVWAADWAARQLQRKDPGCIVSDELAGQWLTLLALPALPLATAWPWWLAAFALFRLFDIVKPWPMRALERLPGGFGIVVDDLAAGCYAAALLLLARALLGT